MDAAPLVLLVLDDDPLAERLREALTDAGLTPCGQARSTASGLALARARRPAVVLVAADVTGDVEALVRAVHRGGLARVVVLGRPAHEVVADLVLAGADGVVAADDLTALGPSLHGVLRGEAALGRGLVGPLLEQCRARNDGGHRPDVTRLTSREHEVLQLLREGRTTQDVARELAVEAVTVRSHVASALRKLRVHTREEALRALGG